MTRVRRRCASRYAIAGLAVGLGWALAVSKPAAAQSVIVTVPVGVSFDVRDVSAATAGSPATTPVTFTGANSFGKQDKLRISVKADTSAFSGPGSVHPAASKVSWTATASGGTASNGTLSATTYTQVFQSPGNVKPSDSGTANIAWTLASIVAPGLRSGTHTLSVRWKFEIF